MSAPPPGSRTDLQECPKRTVRFGAMRLLVARCEVLYTGRLTARLPEAVRLLMFKSDGSFLNQTALSWYMTTQAVSDL